MSVPTSEIPQEEQDHLRTLVNSATWGRLPSAVQDRLMRELRDRATQPEAVGAYHELLEPTAGESQSHFPDLPEADQIRVLDTFDHDSSVGHAIVLALAIDEIHGLPGPVRDAALGVACAILDYPRPSAVDRLRHAGRTVLAVVQGATPSPPEQEIATYDAWRATMVSRTETLSATLHHQTFRDLQQPDKLLVLRVLRHTGRMGLAHFLELLEPAHERWAPSSVADGTTPFLSVDLLNGRRLLDWLSDLAGGTLDGRVGFHHWRIPLPAPEQSRSNRRNRNPSPPAEPQRAFNPAGEESARYQAPEVHLAVAIGDLVCEVARPDQYQNQSNRGTCAMTSVLHRLSLRAPAEYARLAFQLLTSGTGQLRGGTALTPPADAFPWDHSVRSASERLLQASFMQAWGSGMRRRDHSRADYHNSMPAHRDATNPTGMATDGFDAGARHDATLDNRDTVRLLDAAFGGSHRYRAAADIAGPAGGQPVITAMRAHFTAHPTRPVLIGLNWSTGGHMIEVLGFVPAEGTTGPRARFWNPWGALTFAEYRGFPIRIAAGDVGPTGSTSGRRPRVRTLDDGRGIQEIPLAQLTALINAAFFDVPAP